MPRPFDDGGSSTTSETCSGSAQYSRRGAYHTPATCVSIYYRARWEGLSHSGVPGKVLYRVDDISFLMRALDTR